MYAMFNGQPIFGPRGPQGPDGNPIGTIISYMGTKAPKDYLICDGATYNISDYLPLAQFFKSQFGTENYFGGDGTTTFAVPDMRNLFLRGFHGTSEEQLSGDVGVKQEGTIYPNTFSLTDGIYMYHAQGQSSASVRNEDVSFIDSIGYVKAGGPYESINSQMARYTSRPVNMAVLYCIKAKTAESYENVYSTEETRIGTWIDGKPLYRVCLEIPKTSVVDGNYATLENFFNTNVHVVSYGGYCTRTNDSSIVFIPGVLTLVLYQGNKWILRANGMSGEYYGYVWVEYTKTTDPTPASQTTLLSSKVDLPTKVTLNSSTSSSNSPITVTFPSTAIIASASASSAASFASLRFPYSIASASSVASYARPKI